MNRIKQLCVFSLGFFREVTNRTWTSSLPKGGPASEFSSRWYFVPTKTFHVNQGTQVASQVF